MGHAQRVPLEVPSAATVAAMTTTPSEAWICAPTEDAARKFNNNGTARSYRGNTVISFVAPDSPLGLCVSGVRDMVASSASSLRWTFLPPSSYHMTVIQLLSEAVREPVAWSSRLDLGCSLGHADKFMASALSEMEPPTALEMRYRDITVRGGMAINLDPATPETRVALTGYRDAVADATGVRRPDHDEYVFHVGLAYRVDRLTVDESVDLAATLAAAHDMLDTGDTFVLAAPELVFFDDMLEFRPGARHSGAATPTGPAR